jgi:hypothetical protein
LEANSFKNLRILAKSSLEISVPGEIHGAKPFKLLEAAQADWRFTKLSLAEFQIRSYHQRRPDEESGRNKIQFLKQLFMGLLAAGSGGENRVSSQSPPFFYFIDALEFCDELRK